MSDTITIPVKLVHGEKWGDLSAIGLTHEVCGEKVNLKNEKFSFAGGHRVRLYSFKKNVHWRIPEGVDLDISDVKELSPPQRKKRRK